MIERIDNLVIGGGIYGTSVALALVEELTDQKTVLLEQEPELLSRASTNNHGRLHAGYQYPKSPETAEEAKYCRERFLEDYADCVDSDRALYAIHQSSSVTSADYIKFCEDVGLSLEPADTDSNGIFGKEVTTAFTIAEQTFSAAALKQRILIRVAGAGLEVRTGISVASLHPEDGRITVRTGEGVGIAARRVFNCAYSAVNEIHANTGIPPVPTVNEKYLLFGLNLPGELEGTSVTVAYGAFSSFVVNRKSGTHVLAHVTHSNLGSRLHLPPDRTKSPDAAVKFATSVRESLGYLPILAEARYTGVNVEEIKSFVGGDSAENAQGCRSSAVYENYGGIEGYTVVFGGKMTGSYKASETAVRLAGGQNRTSVIFRGCAPEKSLGDIDAA